MYLHFNTFLFMFNILSCLLVKSAKAQGCHRLSTLDKPTVKLLCAGFNNTLNFNTTIEEDITEIELSKNQITVINEVSFNRLANNILHIYLDNNGITNIGPNSFKDFPNLEVIDLSCNNLSSIDPKVFLLNTKLKVIDLTGNNIQTLFGDELKKFANLEEFILSDNPLNVCHKETAETFKYLQSRHIKTYFLNSCDGLTEEYVGFKAIDTSEGSLEEFSYILIALGFLLLLAIVMTVVVVILFLRICKKKKFGSTNSRSRTISGNYLLQSNRCSTASEDKYGYLKPNYPRGLLADMSESNALIKGHGVIPVNPVSNVSVYGGSEYSGSHIYEEILEPSVYEKNTFYGFPPQN